MRARGLCGALAVLLTCGFGLARGSANAETGTSELQTPGATPRAPLEAGEGREVWWAHAREVLLSDLQLSTEQSRGVNEILELQMAALTRQRELGAELQVARQRGDKERSASLRAEMRAGRAARKNPHDVMDAMRALLSEEQRPTFDMNRARLVAEGQQAERARQAQRRMRQAVGGGGGGAEAEVE